MTYTKKTACVCIHEMREENDRGLIMVCVSTHQILHMWFSLYVWMRDHAHTRTFYIWYAVLTLSLGAPPNTHKMLCSPYLAGWREWDSELVSHRLYHTWLYLPTATDPSHIIQCISQSGDGVAIIRSSEHDLTVNKWVRFASLESSMRCHCLKGK